MCAEPRRSEATADANSASLDASAIRGVHALFLVPGWRLAMKGVATAFVVFALLTRAVTVLPADRAAELKAGLLLYAAPGLPDPNFEQTVVLLVEHGSRGSLGLVINRPTSLGVDAALDLKQGTLGVDLPLYWGGPVQPEAILALVRSPRAGSLGRTVVKDVQITRDLDEVKAALAQRDPLVRVRVFSGYAGWDRDQLATEVRSGGWVLDRADAATVFTPEPSRLWRRVYEILSRLRASLDPGGALIGSATSAPVARVRRLRQLPKADPDPRRSTACSDRPAYLKSSCA